MELEQLNEITSVIVQAGIEIHRALGPGLLESVYRSCMKYELQLHGLRVVTEQPVTIRYKDLRLDGSYRLDLLVHDVVIVEIKSIETLLPVHAAQVLSYMRLMDKRLGLLMNFNVPQMVKGIKRIIN